MLTMDNNHIFMDRSRTEMKQKCHRAGYWGYYYHGRGIQLAREIPPPWNLLTGTYTHNGMERILKGQNPAGVAIDEGMKYVTDISPLFMDIEEGPAKTNLINTLKEGSEIVTGFIYGWARLKLPEYLAIYEPEAIETEESITFQVGDTELTLMTRLDILSKIKGSDNRIIHNFKTVTNADSTWREQWRYDQQTLTEHIAVENRIGKQITGTIIEGLVKGSKSEYPEDSSQWRHNNPMVYMWEKADGSDYQAKYKWKCDSPHIMSKGKECPGGQNHTRSGYFKSSVADKYPGGIISWIDHLLADEPATLQPYFITLPPITRSDWEIERWKRQTLAREIEDVNHAREIERLITIEPDTAAILLDHYFPMVTGHGNCIRMSRCPYLDICWGAADPDDLSVFKPREVNHPMEGGQWQ